MAEIEDILLDAVRAVGLPLEEPLAQWLAEPDATSLSLGAGDHKLRIDRCTYEVLPNGAVLVVDHRDPRIARGARCTSRAARRRTCRPRSRSALSSGSERRPGRPIGRPAAGGAAKSAITRCEPSPWRTWQAMRVLWRVVLPIGLAVALALGAVGVWENQRVGARYCGSHSSQPKYDSFGDVIGNPRVCDFYTHHTYHRDATLFWYAGGAVAILTLATMPLLRMRDKPH